jgi:hypothetical protein
MMETREQKEERYREFGAALDCLERLSKGQLNLLKGAIENELSARLDANHIVDTNKMVLTPRPIVVG